MATDPPPKGAPSDKSDAGAWDSKRQSGAQPAGPRPTDPPPPPPTPTPDESFTAHGPHGEPAPPAPDRKAGS